MASTGGARRAGRARTDGRPQESLKPSRPWEDDPAMKLALDQVPSNIRSNAPSNILLTERSVERSVECSIKR